MILGYKIDYIKEQLNIPFYKRDLDHDTISKIRQEIGETVETMTDEVSKSELYKIYGVCGLSGYYDVGTVDNIKIRIIPDRGYGYDHEIILFNNIDPIKHIRITYKNQKTFGVKLEWKSGFTTCIEKDQDSNNYNQIIEKFFFNSNNYILQQKINPINNSLIKNMFTMFDSILQLNFITFIKTDVFTNRLTNNPSFDKFLIDIFKLDKTDFVELGGLEDFEIRNRNVSDDEILELYKEAIDNNSENFKYHMSESLVDQNIDLNIDPDNEIIGICI